MIIFVLRGLLSEVKVKILIAEDEFTIGRIFQIMLEGSGHTVTLTTDGEQCVEAYKHATIQSSNRSEEYLAEHPPFDAVLMDGRMPIMDGVQAAKKILHINKQQRIIFITAYMRNTIETSLNDFPKPLEIISKPVDLDVLLDIVEGGSSKTVVSPQ